MSYQNLAEGVIRDVCQLLAVKLGDYELLKMAVSRSNPGRPWVD